MTKYYYPVVVQHRCGHQETHQLAGNRIGRVIDSQKIAQTDCSVCSKRKMERRRDLEESARQMGLPVLEGTFAQVTWSLDIRQKVCAALIARGYSKSEAVSLAGRRVSAKWWIENHKKSYSEFVEILENVERAA